MHILHVNDVAYVASTLIQGLNSAGHKAELRRLRLPAARRSTAVKLMALPLRLKEWASVNRQVRRGHYDVVHIHFAYLGWLGILGRYPYFLHCHGSDVRRDLRDTLRRWPILRSLARAHVVFFSTPDLASLVHPIRPDALFLPNPVDMDQFCPVASNEQRAPRILIVSTLLPIKKVNVAFEAVQRLLTRYPEVEVIAITQGPERERYLGTPGVTFIDPVPHAMMPAFINSCDIVLGQFGLGVCGMAELESMACEKPVICYFDRRYSDTYPELPPVLSTNRAEEAAEYLSALVWNPSLCQERGRQGRVWVQKYHALTTITKRLEQIYQLA
jgi:glycosyltransferase involved in cell wall biosynthesis